MKNRPLTTLLAALFAGAATPALAVGLDTHGTAPEPTPTPPPPPVVTCTLNDSDITVTSFADILGYQIKGTCKVSFPGTSLKPVPSAPYEGGGSWNASNGMVNEFLKGRDAKNQLWEIQGGGTCKLDPWMTGVAAAGCSTSIGSASPNSPANFLKNLRVPISAGVLDQQARAWLTGKTLKAIKAEHQAPVVVKPTEGESFTGGVTLKIDAGPASPTKNFALEWQALVSGGWAAKSVLDQSGATAQIPAAKFVGSGDWRVRARAHQTAKASWSGWRAFKVATMAPPPPPPACANTKAYGATYDVSAMPSTMSAAATTTVTIKVTNGSNQTWGAGSSFHLAYHWAQNGAIVVFDGERTFLAQAVAPCQQVTLTANVKTPAAAGTWEIRWDMVNEGVTWFSDQGVPTGNRPVTIGSAAMPLPPGAKK